MQHPKTIKIVADTEGGHVVINESDFNPKTHEVFEEEGERKPKPVVLTVDQLKAALTEKGIAIPDGAKKADLQTLFDAAQKA